MITCPLNCPCEFQGIESRSLFTFQNVKCHHCERTHNVHAQEKPMYMEKLYTTVVRVQCLCGHYLQIKTYAVVEEQNEMAQC